ncbi:hypothetical protein [Enterobacter ludwigii]|nr:hypothetical protein [Enterobacter ludwigii]
MLSMSGYLLSAADRATHYDGSTPGKGTVLTSELLMTAIVPLFDDAV